MTSATRNTCALARARFTHDRSVCPVVMLRDIDAEDPDAEWPPWCSLTDDKPLLGFNHWTDPVFDARLQAVNESVRRLEEFWRGNLCRVSP